ncbi:hypothetical protein D3C85_559480 [compost metagenome]
MNDPHRAVEAGGEILRQRQARHRLLRDQAQRGKIGDDVQVLATEQVTSLVHSAEHPAQVIEAEIIDVFVEQIEPGFMLKDPVEARHFDVDLPALVGVGNFSEEAHRILNVLQNMPQDDGVRSQTETASERRYDHVGVIAFVSRIDARDRIAQALEQFKKVALAAADFDQLLALEVPGDDAFDVAQVLLELP